MSFCLLPFAMLYNHNDVHVMLCFEGHMEYVSIEAFIHQTGENKTRLRVIMTGKDGMQWDYVNDEGVITRTRQDSVNRNIVYSNIICKRNMEHGKPNVFIEFASIRNEHVALSFYSAAQPSEKHAGVADPQNHSQTTSLPIMYRKRSTLASKKSKMTIDGKSYPVPVLVHIPFFFTSLKGYYSEGFSLGVFRTSQREMYLKSQPKSMMVGEEWVYNIGETEEKFTLVKSASNGFVAENEKQRIHLISKDGLPFLKRVEAFESKTESLHQMLALEFSQPLPLTLSGIKDICESVFAVSINDQPQVIVGRVSIRIQDNAILYVLEAKEPEWAAKRPYYALVSPQVDHFMIQTGIGHENPV